MTYLLLFATVAVMAIDRFVLKRGESKLISIGKHDELPNSHRFEVNFTLGFARLRGAKIEYELRDACDPRTVIVGKTRSLEFSSKGLNREYLTINKRHFPHIACSTEWRLHVKISHGDSWWNPLFRIFPFSSEKTKIFHIENPYQDR